MKKKQQIDLLKFCRYYKGEKDCPSEIQKDWKQYRFWRMEQEWDLHGINRQYTVSKFVKFFPDTAYIFN